MARYLGRDEWPTLTTFDKYPGKIVNEHPFRLVGFGYIASAGVLN